MTSNLGDLSPIEVRGERLPTPHIFNNIPMLHRILEEVLEDWLRAVEPYQKRIDISGDEGSKTFAVASGFMDLQPLLLKCLFSYTFFFVAADNAYAYFYRELNRANNLLGLKLKHGKPPKKSSFITKIGTIRDIAIAHFPSEKADPIDAVAAMSWQPMALSYESGGHPNLEELTFAPGWFRGKDASGRVIQSRDLEVPGVKTAHTKYCLPYLEQYDMVCCEYLCALRDAI